MLLTGSKTWSALDISLLESSTDAAFWMSDPETLLASPSATSSLASESGRRHFVEQVGQMIAVYGLDRVLASLSARQAEVAGLTTSGICGPLGSTSSSSAALQSCLESRLQARLQGLGSTLFKMTSKPWVTPSGRSRSRLRASAPRTSETGCTGWPAPIAMDAKGVDYTYGNGDHEKVCLYLGGAAKLASWPTAKSTDGLKGAGLSVNGQDLVATAMMASGWPTAAARDWKSSASNKHGDNARPLNEVARLASWGTPTANAYDGNPEPAIARKQALGIGDTATMLAQQVRLTVSGPAPTGSPAETAKPGQLNPEHSRWLMGLSAVWGSCAPTATRSSSRKRGSGSKR